MKRILILIIIIILVTSGLYYSINQEIEVEDIESIILAESANEITSKDELKNYIPLLSDDDNSLEKNLNLSNLEKIIYQLEDGNIIEVSFLRDFENRRIYYKNNDDKFFSLNREDSFYFFNNPSFKEIYRKYEPNINFFYNDDLLAPYSAGYSINYLITENNKINYKWYQEDQTSKYLIENPKSLKIDTNNNQVKLSVFRNDEMIYPQTIIKDSSIFIPDHDGTFIYNFEIESTENSVIASTKSVNYQIKLDREPIFSLSKDTVLQGDFLEVYGKYTGIEESIIIESALVENTIFYENGTEVLAYIPIPARIKPGTYNLNIKTKNNYQETYQLEVLSRDFKTQHLYVNASTMASSSNANAYDEYNKFFHPVRKVSSDKRYYDESFIMPLKARITTEFGEGRYINDRVTSYSHSGLDLAASLGTPVHVINHGVVKLSRHFALTGNTIIIDHGQGLLSYYLHLDTLNVNLDDQVSKGDIIGTVGSTGRSTGPHLHFGTSFYTTYIEPGYLIFNQPITKENYEELIDLNILQNN